MDAATAAWIGLLGALVGGLIGGVGSYYGSINASNRNVAFTQKIQVLNAQAQLHRQLEFSIFKIDKWNEQIVKCNEFEKLFYVEYLIYDFEWHKHLGILLDQIPIEYQDIIVLWFDSLADLISVAKLNDGFIPGAKIVRFVGQVSQLKEDVLEVLRFIVTLRAV